MKSIKQLLRPERLRQVPEQFSWVDQALVQQHFTDRTRRQRIPLAALLLASSMPARHRGVPHCLGCEYRLNCRGTHRPVRHQIGWVDDSKLARVVTPSGLTLARGSCGHC